MSELHSPEQRLPIQPYSQGARAGQSRWLACGCLCKEVDCRSFLGTGADTIEHRSVYYEPSIFADDCSDSARSTVWRYPANKTIRQFGWGPFFMSFAFWRYCSPGNDGESNGHWLYCQCYITPTFHLIDGSSDHGSYHFYAWPFACFVRIHSFGTRLILARSGGPRLSNAHNV